MHVAILKCAVVGRGNIGTDQMIKSLKGSEALELAAMVGIGLESEVQVLAHGRGVAMPRKDTEGLQMLPVHPEIGVVLEDPSACAHKAQDTMMQQEGKLVVDLTPAAIGQFSVRPVDSALENGIRNVNIVTDAAVCSIRAPHQSVRNILRKMAPSHFALGGQSVAAKVANDV